MMKNFATPTSLIEARMRALKQGDFSLIYDSYHVEAPFLCQFSGKSEYLVFADQQLKTIKLTEWEILGQRQETEGDVELLVWMHISVGESALDLYELARLIDTDCGWRYHSAQKLTSEEYSGPVEKIDFENFDQASPKIRF